MAYSADSFVADEQPTTAKWNKLWSNDASFNDGSGIGDDTIDSRHYVAGSVDYEHLGSDVGAWQELADVELGSAGDSLSSGTFTAKKFLRWEAYILPSGVYTIQLRFNNDSGANYAHRYTIDNTVGSSGTSVTNIGNFEGAAANPITIRGECNNFTATQKLGFTRSVSGSSSAATAPAYVDFYFKWANTSAQITRLDIINVAASTDMAAGSRLVVYGRD